MTVLLDNQLEHALPAEYGREIFRCQIGSGIHGVTIDGYDDRDEMGVCIEPPEYVIGLKKVMAPDGALKEFGQWIYRTQPEGVRSGYGDLDLTVYSLRKWARLALAGNPTVLMPLFVPEAEVVVNTELGRALRAFPERFLSRQTADRFLGYMHAQREQMMGLRGKKHTNRPELVERFGFDTKFAYHMIRLGLQGCELLIHGRITLPVPEPARSELLALRRGEMSRDDALEWATGLEHQLMVLRGKAHLPEHPDYERANVWLVEAYQTEWERAK